MSFHYLIAQTSGILGFPWNSLTYITINQMEHDKHDISTDVVNSSTKSSSNCRISKVAHPNHSFSMFKREERRRTFYMNKVLFVI